jgi:hypothetical protein
LFHNCDAFLADSDHRADSKTQACRQAIDGFARDLEASLFDGSPWPAGWIGDARECRSRMIAASLNLGDRPAFPPICALIDPSDLPGEIRVPTHLSPPFSGSAWEGIRIIDDPAIRRAVLWLLGWWTCPAWDVGCRPSWARRAGQSFLDKTLAVSRRYRRGANRVAASGPPARLRRARHHPEPGATAMPGGPRRD